MSDFQQFLHQQANVATARAEYNYSSCKLENASIQMRLAEIKSQHQPLATLAALTTLTERQRMYAAAYYVVHGRIPESV